MLMRIRKFILVTVGISLPLLRPVEASSYVYVYSFDTVSIGAVAWSFQSGTKTFSGSTNSISGYLQHRIDTESSYTFTVTGKTGYQDPKFTVVEMNSGSVVSSNLYTQSQSFTVSAPVAQIHVLASAPKTYTVTFNPVLSGATVSPLSRTVTYASTYGQLPTPSRAGYTFNNWWTAQTGGSQVLATTKVTEAANHTIYAHWTANTYKLTVAPNGGVFRGGTTNYVMNPDMTYNARSWCSLPAVTRTGYNLTGLWTAKSGGTMVYDKNRLNVKSSYWSAAYDSGVFVGTSDLTVYAQWTNKTSLVTLQKEGGSGGTDSVVAMYDREMPAAVMPSWIGHTFQGYYGYYGTMYYNASGNSSHNWNVESGTANLYAHWTTNTYTVYLNSSQGSGGSSQVTATYGEPMPAATMPTKTGYAFGGYWTSTGSGGVQYYNAAGQSTRGWDQTSSTTLYAKWEGNEYTLTLAPNGGATEGGTTNQVKGTKLKYGSKRWNAIGTATRTGHTFTGWWTSASGGTRLYDESGHNLKSDYWTDAYTNGSFIGTADLTVYAQWTANQYTVTLGKNGGSGGTSSVTATFAQSMPAITVPTHTGYAFGGYWTTVLKADGVQYYAADGTSSHIYDKASDSTLWAKWTGNSYTVSLDQQGATTPGTTSVAATYGTSMPHIDQLPTRTGFAFGGYWDGMYGSGNEYYDEHGDSVTSWNKTANSTLYAKWIGDAVEVTFNKNGGGAETAKNEQVGTYYVLPSNPTREGYGFGGWWTTAGGGTQVTTNTVVENQSAHTLYAHWNARSYTVTFNGNGGTSSASTKTVTFDSAYGDLPTATRIGYSFSGWWTDATGGNQIGAESIVATAANQTLYAHWTAMTTLVTFSKTGGSGGDASATATYDQPMPAVSIPLMTGYSFLGYWTAESGGTQYYTGDGKSKNKWNITSSTYMLYAQWSPKSYTVTFDPVGGTVGTVTKTVTFASTYGTLPTPVLDGYDFGGWCTAQTGGTQVTASTTVSITADQTLYARWTGSRYVIRYNAGPVGLFTNSPNASIHVITNFVSGSSTEWKSISTYYDGMVKRTNILEQVGTQYHFPHPFKFDLSSTNRFMSSWCWVKNGNVTNYIDESDSPLVVPESVGATNLTAVWGP